MSAFEIYLTCALILFLGVVLFLFRKQILDYHKRHKKRGMQRRIYHLAKLNNYLILCDIYFPASESKIKHVDTFIIGNKYLYVCREVAEKGKIEVSLDDPKWRVINDNQLKIIDNPFILNSTIISYLTNALNGLSTNLLKSLVIVSKDAKFDYLSSNENEFIISEKEVIKFISQYEKESNDETLSFENQEQIAKELYEQGKVLDKIIKRRN